ncbi:UDP-glucose 4-epimerase GalE [Sedimenticola selenatireducens]|uniref:UDP-glucose 4-epimerase n=1 Tax=Sedimenticola selenatireducens TaxID=191960 RepID=A0A558DQW1_9GAMM|nr:UDP-glucose 4-epimerase GalE [Sedimenticola selenatireducens]TVO73478.1 UDP-glucose 4-epimerase GalE [Sedimenticola selenatireducens]TVT63419.1 MAG: UDP-glucose 4-epimerase GalE [Sedimenticola selenatireducens]
MRILVTGGAGYIGSHTCVELLEAGHEVVVVDNLCNSYRESLNRVKQIAGKDVLFIQGDIRDAALLENTFQQHPVDAVIHFAGLKAVGESTEIPLDYYQNNIAGTLTLLEAMKSAGVKTFVFSSSATVYGDPEALPIREEFPLSASNPYGRSKLIIEDILRDIYASDKSWNISILRYFNPAGAHKSGLIGEDPNGIPNNLMPYIAQVAAGRLEQLSVYGNDYPTADGTGVRDYIHVVDLAKGHIAALDKLDEKPGLIIHNLGTGQGYSVLDMVNAFVQTSGRDVPYRIVDRRPGDIAACYADPSLAEKELGWHAMLGLDAMCQDAWRWQSNNPNGYRDS